MYKVVHLLKRQAQLDPKTFQERLRDRHASLAAKLPRLRKYVQSHVLLQGYGKGELPFDGVEELWFDARDDFVRAKESDAAVLCQDSLRTFVDVPNSVEMAVTVYVIKDGVVPENAVKNIEFVKRRPGLATDAFRHHWLAVHGPLAAQIPVIHRYEQNHAIAEDSERGPLDGVAVTWFASTQDMRLGTSTPEYKIAAEDEPKFLPDGAVPFVITRESRIV